MWLIYLGELSEVKEKRARRRGADTGLAKKVQAECPQRQRPRRGCLLFPENTCISVCVCASFSAMS